MKERWLWHDIKKYNQSYLMVLPYTVFFVIFVVVPVITAIVLSFTYFNMISPVRFIGLENYKRLFLNDDVFLISIKNTMLFAFVTGPVSYFVALITAWFINELNPKLRAFMTLVFYAPSVAGNAYIIWTFIFSGDRYGILNGFLIQTGLISESIQWLTDPKTNLTVIIIVQLWLSLGAGFLAFIAGLQTIDRSMYEAGAVDGIRNRWQELWHITLPSMKPQLLFGAVMQIASSFAVSDVAEQLAGFPSTNYSAHTIVTHIKDVGTLRYEMGYACAIAVVLFSMMVMIKSIFSNLMAKE